MPFTARRALAALCVVALGLPGAFPSLRAGDSPFVRGDANLDETLDISDGVAVLNILFLGQPGPGCDDALDANDDGTVDISDGVYALAFLFTGGPPPAAPWPACGSDPTADGLTCARFPPCEDTGACLGDAALAALIDENVAGTACLAADLAELEVAGFTVLVCPESLAEPCGPDELPGCAVEFDNVSGEVRAPEKEVAVSVEGSVPRLPVRIDSGVSELECVGRVEFSGNAVVPFTTQGGPGGRPVVTTLGPSRLEAAELDITVVEGGFLCGALESQADAFEDELSGQLASAIDEIVAGLEPDVVGLPLCETP